MFIMFTVVMEVGGNLEADIATGLRGEIPESIKIVAVFGIEQILYAEFDA